jgi:hypothetical protein
VKNTTLRITIEFNATDFSVMHDLISLKPPVLAGKLQQKMIVEEGFHKPEILLLSLGIASQFVVILADRRKKIPNKFY